MKKQVRIVTEGAMMLAIIGVVLYLNRMTGNALMGFLIFVLPLPAVFYIAKYGIRQGFILSFAILLLPILLGDFVALFYVGTSIVVGLVYGYGIHKDKDNGWLLLIPGFVIAVSSFFEVYLLAAFVGEDFIAEMKQIIDSLIAQMQSSGNPMPANTETLILSMIPMVLILVSYAQAFVTHFAAIVMLKRLKIKTRTMKPMIEWVLPKKFAILFAIGIFANLGLKFTTNENIQIVLTNIYSISSLAFGVDAYIFIMLFARISRKRFLVFLGLLVFIITPIGTAIGLFDCFTDMRKRVLYNYVKPLR